MKKLFLLAAILIAVSTHVLADIAPPPGKSPNRVKKPESGISTTLSIRLDQNAAEARLIIPKAQVRQLRAELEELDNESDDRAAAAEASAGFSRAQTLMSGVFLSLALVFGGLWFVRSGKGSKTFVILAAVACVGSAATFVLANVGPPNEARSINGKLFSPAVHTYKQAWGKVKMETSANGDTIQLIVPDPQSPAGE